MRSPTGKRAPRRRRAERSRPHIQAVVDETIALFRWLSWVSDQLYGDDARGAARRWVLRRLHRDGPMTVPRLARARTLRRQSMQPVVDALVADGLVRWLANPRHARSRLASLTGRGAALVTRLDRIDADVLRAVGRGIPAAELAAAAATLRALRAGFEVEPRWRVPARAGQPGWSGNITPS